MPAGPIGPFPSEPEFGDTPYYRHRKAESGSASAAAFGAAFDVLQPSRQIVTEERRHQHVLRDDTGNARDRADSPPDEPT